MEKAIFQAAILDWYHEHKRDLPWRNSTDPYIIWLSEIILQQTRVNQGLPYFLKFRKNYPTVHHLAQANEASVMKDWEGLGYYSRARNLHSAAKHISTELQGGFPNTHEDILKLKGVGDYTAAAISSFAFNEPRAVVDGNVFRVLARVFGIATPINSTKGKKEFKALADELMYEKDPATYNQAIMEFGAIQCVPKNPNCNRCPLQQVCYAFAERQVEQLPVKEQKKYNRERYFNYAVINKEGSTLINHRVGKDVWQKLYEWPLVEHSQFLSTEELLEEMSRLGKAEVTIKSVTDLKPHKLSHQTIHCRIFEMEVNANAEPPLRESEKWVARTELKELAFPRPLRQYLDRKQLNLPFDE